MWKCDKPYVFVSYIWETSVDHMYERQVSVSPLDLEKQGPRKEGNITLQQSKNKNKECDCFTTKQRPCTHYPLPQFFNIFLRLPIF
jgi:hypothetical protein